MPNTTCTYGQPRGRRASRRIFVALIAIAWPVLVLDLLGLQTASGPGALMAHEGQNSGGGYHNRTQYGKSVTTCSLTVLLMDPRIPFFPNDDVMYTSALESLGEYAPVDTCFVLQVSSCVMEHHLRKGHERHTAPLPGDWDNLAPGTTIEEEIRTHNGTISPGALQQALYDNTRDKAGPMFGRRMDDGRVRITILDHQRYGFESCLSFYKPSPAWMNYHYYTDEFVEGVDSDQVLFFERDGVLCRPLAAENLELWREFSWVGGPITSWLRGPRWINKMQGWLDRVKGKTFMADWDGGGETIHHFANDFTTTYPSKFVVGNGGVSLRSRKWMRRNIRTCPHKTWSGLGEAHWRDSNCTIFDGDMMDDTYHSVVSKLTRAPVPHPFVASLFVIDTTMPDVVAQQAGPKTEGEQDELIAKYWGKEGINLYRSTLQEDGHAMPIFVHKASRQRQNSGASYYEKMMKRCKYIGDHLFERGGG